ncbi:MAG: Asp-tRNA(Asn)/Glu-tRNA(Gln) amidotransferase subunit GatC [Proteobacteria bacterium]|nr:Asp-tRNA(Asn)/Glu-tRNA(Gln) amidotransferase subunit GatC [Pseudomonadota bacterium]
MALSDKDVKHVAKLSALKIDDQEVQVRVKELGDIFSYIEKLSTLSTRGVPPTSHVHGVVNFFRDDIIKDSFDSDSLDKFAPDFKNNHFRVPKII